MGGNRGAISGSGEFINNTNSERVEVLLVREEIQLTMILA